MRPKRSVDGRWRALWLACALALPACDCTGVASRVFEPDGVHVVGDDPLCPFEVPTTAPTAAWTRAGPPGASVTALLGLGQHVLLVGTSGGRSTGSVYTEGAALYRSTDDGKTVTKVQAVDGTWVHEFVAQADGTVLMAAGSLSGDDDDGVWRSDDRGATFTQDSAGLHTGARVFDLAVAGGTPQRVYALVKGTDLNPLSVAATLYRREGTGAWTAAAMNGFNLTPGGPVTAIAADPTQDRIYAIDGARLYVSTDAGETFTERSMPSLDNPRTLAVLSPNHLLVGTSSSGLFESTDDGTTWTQRLVEADGEQHGVNAVAVDAQQRVFAASSGAGLQRLEGGQGAVVGKCLLDAVVLSVATAPDDAKTMWAGTNGGLYVSDNGGDSVLPAGVGLDELLARVKVASLDGQPTLFLLSSAGLFYTTAASPKWVRQADWAETVAFSDIAMNADGSSGFLAVDEELFPGRYGVPGGLWRWKRSEHLVETVPDFTANVGAVVVDPSQPTRAYAYQRGGTQFPSSVHTGVFVETAAGAGFTETSLVGAHIEGTSTFRFSPLAVATDGTVYAGIANTDGSPALWRSADQGASNQSLWTETGWVAYGTYASPNGDVFLSGWLKDIGVRKSTDGVTFDTADTGLSGFSKFVYALAFDGAGGVVAGTEDGVHFAADGTTYSALNDGFTPVPRVFSVAVLPASPRPIVVAGTTRGVFWRTLP